MLLRLCLLALSAAPAVGQDPATIATAMAGRVAGIMAEKAEQKIDARRKATAPSALITACHSQEAALHGVMSADHLRNMR